MAQFQGVPGPSQDAFDGLSNQIANVNKYTTSGGEPNYDSVFSEFSSSFGFRYDIMDSNATNRPANAVALCFTVKRETSTITLGTQVAIVVNGGMYIRNYNNTSWSNWTSIT